MVSFMNCHFGVISERSLPYPRSSRFSSMAFSSFISLHFAFRSMIHFELIFVKDLRSVSRFFCFFFFFCMWCPIVPEPFVEKAIFPLLYYSCSFVKDQLTIFMGIHFWVLYSILFHWSIFLFFHLYHTVLITTACNNSWSWVVSALQLWSSSK